MTRLKGKTAVITGGATGIGRAAAKRFIEEGAFVFIFGRREEALDAAVADLGPNARAVKGSVSDEADLDRLYAAVKSERGTLDIVFANTGSGSQLPLGKITAEHIDETFDTNVKGTIFTVQKALPLMGPATATELAKEALGEEGQKVYASMTPLQRMADPAEIAAYISIRHFPEFDASSKSVISVQICKTNFTPLPLHNRFYTLLLKRLQSVLEGCNTLITKMLQALAMATEFVYLDRGVDASEFKSAIPFGVYRFALSSSSQRMRLGLKALALAIHIGALQRWYSRLIA
jgi:hypothetical protein